MENITEFINEIKKLDFKLIPKDSRNINQYLDISHYDQSSSKYKNQLEELYQKAVLEITSSDDKQLRRYLIVLRDTEEIFKNAYKGLSELKKIETKTPLINVDYQLHLFSHFNINLTRDQFLRVVIKPDFLYEIVDPIMFKEQYLGLLISDIEKFQGKLIRQTESSYSALEWATIFYYANEAKLTTAGTLKNQMKCFKEQNGVKTTLKNLNAKYYQAKKRLNESCDFPIEKLNKIKPYLKENFPTTVTLLENEIFFLKEEQSDY